jgi:hypothetical protein
MMKVGKAMGFVISLLVVFILSLALLFTNVWYSVLLSGVVASLVIRKGYLLSLLSSFIGGIFAIVIVLLLLPLEYFGPLMSEVGSVVGISSLVLTSLIFLINGGLCVSGSLIGTFITKAFEKN